MKLFEYFRHIFCLKFRKRKIWSIFWLLKILIESMNLKFLCKTDLEIHFCSKNKCVCFYLNIEVTFKDIVSRYTDQIVSGSFKRINHLQWDDRVSIDGREGVRERVRDK